ncbi:hypothetical protein [Acinetobacter colistiniresistens]|uniref:hypothetical protein n=1 Tax=Acinetobacter colistiniresistens TaxID=280145 RepID=UPI00124FCD38|nr:hypothetical protein [Acinetobacter colistiniresistens]
MNQCKCGVAWDSMLYGNTCGRCGEERPVMYAKSVPSTDIPFVESLVSDRIKTIMGQRQEIRELHESIDAIFTGPNSDYLGLDRTVKITSTEAPDPNIVQNALKAAQELLERQKEHDEILKEVAQILIAQNRPSVDGKITVYSFEVDELYLQVKRRRDLKKEHLREFKVEYFPFARMVRPIEIDMAVIKWP